MKEVEIQSMKNENSLRDELELIKDKNNQLIQNEAMIEIYKSRLKEIPELKGKLRQALQANQDLEEMKGAESEGQE